jgi:hypothetical protein
MNRSRLVCGELLRAIEEALAAYSGVSPDLVAHWPAVPEKKLAREWRARPFVAPSPACARKNTAEKLQKER